MYSNNKTGKIPSVDIEISLRSMYHIYVWIQSPFLLLYLSRPSQGFYHTCWTSSWSLRCNCSFLVKPRYVSMLCPIDCRWTASQGCAIGIQPIFIDAWNVRVAMPRISGVLYIRIHDGRGLICPCEGSTRGFLDGHKVTNKTNTVDRFRRLSSGAVISSGNCNSFIHIYNYIKCFKTIENFYEINIEKMTRKYGFK